MSKKDRKTESGHHSDSEVQRKELLGQIEHLIEANEYETLRQLLSDSRSSDVAEVVEVLDEVARQIVFDVLEPEEAGEVLVLLHQ